MRAIGWVIVEGQQGWLFEIYKHRSKDSTAEPYWTTSARRAAIYDTAKEAADVALSIFQRDGVKCTAKALYVGSPSDRD